MKRTVTHFTALFAVFAASSAFAADAGIPQMDQTWFANQLFWLAISFTLLFIVVSKVIAPSIHTVLHTRESAINDAIAEASHARAEAESTRGSAANVSQMARAKAAEIMAAAQAENSRDASLELAKLDHELERRAGHAKAVLDDALVKAQASVDSAAETLAEAIAAQLLHQHISAGVSDGPKLKLAKR
jgi:F-type H+-transporting ATPase subunit b